MFLDTLWSDLKHGTRSLVKSGGFTATAILTLALGIGANVAIFSVIDAVLLRPLPWSDPTRAAMIWSRWTAFDKTWVADAEIIDYRKRLHAFTDIAAWSDGQINVTGTGEPVRVAYAQVTANIFRVLGSAPIVGRTFTDSEDVPKGPQVVVISHAVWVQRFGADPAVIGRTLQLNGQTYEIVGIMPSGFGSRPIIRIPIRLCCGCHCGSTRRRLITDRTVYAAGRLRPGTSIEQATVELHNVAQTMTGEGLYPPQMNFDAFAVSLRDEGPGPVTRAIALLAGAVLFLLLIACANVANLLLARAEGRHRDIAVRTALGADAFRVVRQLLTESLLLSVVGACVGLVAAWAGVATLTWWHPESIPRVGGVGLNARVLVFTLIMSIAVTLVFGLVPAFRSLRIDISDSLKEGRSSTTARAGRRLRGALVVAQTALAVVLLVGAGLLVRSIAALQRTNLGFRADHVLTMRMSLPAASYATPEAVVAFYDRLLERVRSLPGVRAAGAVRSLPLASQIGDWGVDANGYAPPPGTHAKGDWQIATDGYIDAMGERLVRGRAFASTDNITGQLVGLVNEEFARQYWPGRDPIGARFRIGSSMQTPPWITVVGVVANVRHNGIDAAVKEKFYVPFAQWHRVAGNPMREMTLIVRAANESNQLIAPIRAELGRLDPTIPAAEVRTMNDVVAAALSGPRFAGALLSLFAALALVLAAVGQYGVLMYTVSRRTREFGVRIAMGARPGQVLRLVIASGVSLTAVGLVAGMLFAALLTGLMSKLLYDVVPLDPWTFSIVPISLIAVATMASFLPAWRATRVDPVHALRAE